MEIISANRRMGARPQQAARQQRNKEPQAALSPAGIIANGFLRHQFLPLYEPSVKTPPKKAAGEFFNSLHMLAGLYQLQETDVSGKPYPYNVLLAHEDMTVQLNLSNQEVELKIVEDEKGEVRVATKQTYNTGTTLYYIPVIPLYRLLQERKNKWAGDLLLSVFSYLHKFGGIPYYRDDYTALSSYYDMIEEWVTCDWDSIAEEDLRLQLSQLHTNAHYGDVIFRKLYNRIHLDQFKKRIGAFKPKDDFQKDCLQVAKTTYQLWQDFPDSNIFQHTQSPDRNDDTDEDEWIVKAEQYISFIGDTKGWLYDSLSDMVSNEFNECAAMEQPTVEQVFDEDTAAQPENLIFETRIFDLICDLCTLLNDLP